MDSFEPIYYSTFKCIANRCRDNCCIGWEIDIDDNTLEKYNSVNGSFGQKLKNGINNCGNTPCFKLDKNERCVFLNSNNLCDIIINLGEESLCQICTNHPRYVNEYLNITEYGLGIACEEVCRIVLSQQNPIHLVNSENKKKITQNPFKDNYYMAYLFEIRRLITDILQNRNYKINQRLLTVIEICYKVENDCQSSKSDCELLNDIENIKNYANLFIADISDTNNKNINRKTDFQSIKSSLCSIIRDYTSAEILDPKWIELLQNILDKLQSQTEINYNEIHTKLNELIDTELIFENLLVYFTYRYFLESYYDDMITEKALFLFSSYVVVREALVYTLSKVLYCSFENIVEIIHNYSKEIEYSDCNLNHLCKCYSSNKAYNFDNIAKILL